MAQRKKVKRPFLDNLLGAFDEATSQSEADLKTALRDVGKDPDRVIGWGLTCVEKLLGFQQVEAQRRARAHVPVRVVNTRAIVVAAFPEDPRQYNCEALERDLARALNLGSRCLIFDIASLRGLSKAGLTVLVRLGKLWKGRGGDVHVCARSARLGSPTYTALAEYFPCHSSMGSALVAILLKEEQADSGEARDEEQTRA